MPNYFIGKGYGLSDLSDLNGRPLLTYQGPKDKRPFILSDRVAQEFDFTVAQPLKAGSMKNDRLDSATANYIKQKLGGNSDDELDHKISLELGGSNTPSNLVIQHGIKFGASAASDQLENSLALEVAAGRMSLLTAWRTLAEQKGFLLGEDTKTGTTFSISQIASSLYDVGKNLLTGNKAKDIKQADVVLNRQIADDIEKLKQNPQNQVLITKIFQDQVASVSNQLNISPQEGGKTVKSYLGAYASSKGVDPKELMGALNLNVQRILSNSTHNPDIFGVESATISKIATVLEAAGGILLGVGLVLAVAGVLLVGPEVAAAAFAGGLLTAGFAALGVSIPLGLGFLSFEFGGAMTLVGIALNISVAKVYDNTYLLPTQNISSLKEALAIQKGLAAFLPSEQNAAPSTSTKSVGGIAPRIVGNQTGLFIGHIDQGNLKAVTPFQPQEFEGIATPDDLAAAAQHNIGAYLSSIANVLDYSITAKAHVTLPNGTELIGNTVYIPKSVSKKGNVSYKKIQDKFAVVEVYIKTSAKGKIHIEDLVLGAIDETKYQPTPSEFVQLANSLDGKLITTDMKAVTSISLAPSSAPAASTTPTSGQTPSLSAPTPQAPSQSDTTILKYATRNADGDIVAIDANNFPPEDQAAGSQFADGRLRLTSDIFSQVRDEIKKRVGGDKNIGDLVADILYINEPRREDNFRSQLVNLPFGGELAINSFWGGYDKFAQHLINGGTYALKTIDRTTIDPTASAGQITVAVPNPRSSTTAKKPYIQYAGSPDIFDRNTGHHITSSEAMTLDIFNKGLVEHLTTPRPEVKTSSDFAVYAGKDLTNFPV